MFSEEGGWRLRKRRSSCRVAGVLTAWSSREQQRQTARDPPGEYSETCCWSEASHRKWLPDAVCMVGTAQNNNFVQISKLFFFFLCDLVCEEEDGRHHAYSLDLVCLSVCFLFLHTVIITGGLRILVSTVYLFVLKSS